MKTILRTSGLSVSYGGLTALRDVDLDVGEGRLVGLIGPNGAGKTTFIDALTGFTACRGAVTLDGRDLRGTTPHERSRLGLVRTWQTTELFDDLTVGENVAVATHRPSLRNAVKEIITGSSASGTVDGVLDLLGIRWARDAMPGDLSEGQRKLVGVARALASQPRLLCLDEPAAGLDTQESAQLGERLRALADNGTSMLLVDHDMGLVLGVCDWLFVLEFGELIASGTPADIRRDPRVVRAYLGSEAEDEVVREAQNAELVVASDGTDNS